MAEAAAREEEKERAQRFAKLREDPNAPRVETGTPRLTAQQVAETAAYRAICANHDEELVKLMEARVVAVLRRGRAETGGNVRLLRCGGCVRS